MSSLQYHTIFYSLENKQMTEQCEDLHQLINLNDSERTTLVPGGDCCISSVSDDETSSSGVYSDLTVLDGSLDQQSCTINTNANAQLFEKILSAAERNTWMNVYKNKGFCELAKGLYMNDDEVQNEWEQAIDYYKIEYPESTDDNRIEVDFSKCINALMNDERKIMLGLDSAEVIKSFLIACMRMCRQAGYKIQIRVAFGGTKQSLTARTPAYAIAPIFLLRQLLGLFRYLSNRKSSSVSTTTSNTPLLIFYSAYTAAVKANRIEKNVAEQNADAMLMFVQRYINEYHPDLVQYVRYAKDHSNTYQPELLEPISKLLREEKQDELRKELIIHAESHNSTENESIEYASTHLIGFGDIIDNEGVQPLFHLLNQNEISARFDQEIKSPDCIITIGGSVEHLFNQVRSTIQREFSSSLQDNDKDRFYLPLSLPMLSKAGHTPVYYHFKRDEIIVADVLKSNMDDLYQNKNMASDVKTDLLITTDDIGLSTLKPMLECIVENKTSKKISLADPILTLTELCAKYLAEHAEVEHETPESFDETAEVVDQFFEHYDVLHYFNDDTRSIIGCMIDHLKNQKETERKKELKKQNKKNNAIAHQQKDPRLRSSSEILIQPAPATPRCRSNTVFSTESPTDSPHSGGETALSAVLSTASLTDSMISCSSTGLSADSATDTPRLRTSSAFSNNSATSDTYSYNLIRPGRETMNKINEQCNSTFGRIFIAFMKKFAEEQQSNVNE